MKPGGGLRIVVHDYSGHPGQAQLSRALARRGHEVLHQHCPSYVTGKGAVEPQPGDPDGLRFEACPMKSAFNRYSVVQRVAQELRYGLRVGRIISRHAPDVAIISNVPLLAHAVLSVRLRHHRIPMIFWHQDIYSSAIGAAAIRRLPRLGPLIAWAAEQTERTIARSSAAVVAISPTFLDKLTSWGVAERTTIIPNWAPLNEIPRHERHNAWSERMGLSSVPVVMYSGTLGLKHDPSLLALMATHLKATHPTARVVVVSEGKGRQWLETWKRENEADNLLLLDFQDYEELPQMMASADVLVAILEPDASKYSVPSKVLTYLCSGRAILGVIPRDNSVAEILWGNGAGLVTDPAARDKVGEAAAYLLDDELYRRQLGEAGRGYAEREFSPDLAAAQFEEIALGRQLQPAA
ncbi:MAG: glycosyltransferase family 4 protein [Acidimicrobiales bacterium]